MSETPKKEEWRTIEDAVFKPPPYHALKWKVQTLERDLAAAKERA